MNTLLLARLAGLMRKSLVALVTAVLVSQTAAAGAADYVSALSFERSLVHAPTEEHWVSFETKMTSEQPESDGCGQRPSVQRIAENLMLAQNNLGASRLVVARGPEDSLSGASGVDVLESGAGDDFLADGFGSSELLFIAGVGSGSIADAQRVRDFEDGLDLITITGDLQFKDLQIIGDGSGNTVIFDSKNNQYIAVVDRTNASTLTAIDFSFSEQ